MLVKRFVFHARTVADSPTADASQSRPGLYEIPPQTRKRLFLFQGQVDAFFPEDLFHTLARRIANVYAKAGAADACRAQVFPGAHPWDDLRRDALLAFLTGALALDPSRPSGDFPAAVPVNAHAIWPATALSTDALAARLSGIPCRANDTLVQVFLPGLNAEQDVPFPRVGFKQLAAQLWAFNGVRSSPIDPLNDIPTVFHKAMP